MGKSARENCADDKGPLPFGCAFCAVFGSYLYYATSGAGLQAYFMRRAVRKSPFPGMKTEN